MVFTLSLQGAEAFGEGQYFVRWTRTGDDVRHAVVGGRRIVSSAEAEGSFVRRFREAVPR